MEQSIVLGGKDAGRKQVRRDNCLLGYLLCEQDLTMKADVGWDHDGERTKIIR